MSEKGLVFIAIETVEEIEGSHGVAGAQQKKSSRKGEKKRGRRGEDLTCNADANLVDKNSLLIDSLCSISISKKPCDKFRAQTYTSGSGVLCITKRIHHAKIVPSRLLLSTPYKTSL